MTTGTAEQPVWGSDPALADVSGFSSHAAFIREHCRLMPVPLVPEVSLYLAHEALPLWRKTEAELDALGLPPPYWAFAWAGGQALARYILDNPARVHGRCVVDLATGSGLVAIAAMRAGAARVLAADIDPFASAAAMLNAEENGITIETTGDDLLATALPVCDIVLAGDIFYEKALAERATTAFCAARRNGTEVLIGDPKRSYFPKEHLNLLLEYQVPVTRELEDAEIKRTAVWEFDPVPPR